MPIPTAQETGYGLGMFELTATCWRSGPVAAATTFRRRLRGLRPAPDGHGLLLRARSIHTWGMRVPIWAAALDSDGVAIRVALLEPGRLLIVPKATWILELPIECHPPEPGTRLTHLGFEHGGNPLPVRHADREPR